MNTKQIAAFGSWKSPITSDLILSGAIGLGGVIVDGQDIYWLEGRPSEGGRNVIVRRSIDGTITDITPMPFNVRTRVHEYGGGSCLIADGTIYFVNFADQRVYKQQVGSEPQPLTPENQKRYADFNLDRSRNRLICVCEDHSNDAGEPENSLVSIDIDSGEIVTLVAGNDFYSSPRLSHDGTQLAFITWHHPHMPWDASELWLASVNNDGSIDKKEYVAGEIDRSATEPKWSPDGKLYFAWEATGWWNLYRRHSDGTIEPLHLMEAEFAYPHWIFGICNYNFLDGDRLVCTYTQNGSWYLGTINTQTKKIDRVDLPYTSFSGVEIQDRKLVSIIGSPTETTAVASIDLETKKIEIIKRSSELKVDPGYLSIPQAIAFPTANNLTAYAWYYPPQNQDYQAPEGELPPLLVKSHGGPTAAASATLNLRIQYWTSRGFAYLDVNYGGSTGYGREYRQRLDRNWGIVDVDDCVNAAKYLVSQNKADKDKLAISGGSAGGYTTLAALTFRDTFKAGASHYGVSDLEILVKDTHKFESRYLDRLVGAYPAEKSIYEDRSPIHHTQQLACPVIFFQGLEDRVVPPNQAEMMFAAIKNKGLPVAYVPFPGEQHGFRRAENIKRALDGEFYFYSRIFGFQPSDSIEAIEIVNLS